MDMSKFEFNFFYIPFFKIIFRREVVIADWTKKAIEALRKGDMAASRALAAVAPICAESLIIPPLMESLGVWEFGGIPDNVAFKMLDVLTLSLKACAKSNKNKSFCKETVQRIGEILHAGKGTHYLLFCLI